MKLSILKDKQYNLQELTSNEALSTNGGDCEENDESGGFWEEVGQFASNVKETIKDIGDDDEWFG